MARRFSAYSGSGHPCTSAMALVSFTASLAPKQTVTSTGGVGSSSGKTCFRSATASLELYPEYPRRRTSACRR
jgi:hypothetical protein